MSGNACSVTFDLRNHSTPLNETCWMSDSMSTCVVAVYCLLIGLGLLGNGCLVAIIVAQRDRANVTSILIANLSVSDILVCLFCLPFTVVYTLMDQWVFGPMLCHLLPYVQCVSVNVSILSLTLIALERQQLILHPGGWKPTVVQAHVGVLLVWLLACLSSLPFLVFQSLMEDQHTEFQLCVECWPSESARRAYTTTLLLLQYCVPLLLIMVCYARVFLRLRRPQTSQRQRNRRRITVMLVALVMAFALCWLPLNAFNLVADWKPMALSTCHHDLLFSLCHLLAMCSTIVNPVIYGLLNRNFRQEMLGILLHCRWAAARGHCEHVPLATINTELSRTSLQRHCKNSSL
ncbi:neuropeptide Y receptor type 4 [Denticeps clupeoides]|uniref:neuropeptide Y receptor type 4 n=1 Tax=Denticeps clupeoides TaxID=299321 RepID=UPI0010A2F3A8|nr:neuropeptide Y receptor type 4-like [Denticeps clupeoides]